MSINWNDVKTITGEIDLVKAYKLQYPSHFNSYIDDYLSEIMSVRPVVSRQAAAVALATAYTLFDRMEIHIPNV